MDIKTAEQVHKRLTAAAWAGDAALMQKLLDQHPEFPPPSNSRWLCSIHDAAAYSGFDTFKVFVTRFPKTKTWDVDHTGNHVGMAAAAGDVPFLKFLLEELESNANEGWFLHHTPILAYVDGYGTQGKNRKQVMRLLKKHGSTMEGEGVCHRTSHKMRDGSLCWHRDWGVPIAECPKLAGQDVSCCVVS